MAKKTKKKVNKKVSKQEKKGRIIYSIVILFAFVFSLVVIITNLAEIRAKRREKIVDVNIRRLRMKIEDQPSTPRHIVTVWGLGYKWES